MPSPVRVALLGNSFAQAIQLPALKYAGNNHVFGIAGQNLDKAAETANEWGIACATDNWRELLAQAPDLVIISTPVDLHFDMARAALEAGAAVLCEKPFTMNAAQAEQLVSLARGRLALVDHQLRWSPVRRRLRDLVREKFVGDIFNIRSDMVLDSPHYLTRGFGWWFEEARGGGVLGALASHMIDNLLWIFGPIASVSARLETFVKQRQNAAGEPQTVTSDDFCELSLRLADGPLISLTSSVVMPGGNRWLIEITGSEGTLRLDMEDDLIGGKHGQDMAPLADDVALPLPESFGMGATGAFAACEPLFLKDVIAAVAAGRTELAEAASFEDGLKCMRILDAARKSSRQEGEWIPCL